MNTADFIYGQIYKGGLSAGASERASFNAAVTGLESFKKGRFKKASKLIEEKIKEAKKETKRES